MTSLNQKLARDLWRMKGQCFAIAVVIALGVLMLVMMDGLYNSLTETKTAYYERYRFAKIFAPVKRAPNHILKSLANIDGVSSVEGRIKGGALINLPHINVPISAQAVSLPDFDSPKLNDIYLAAGRRINQNHEDEIILLRGFANANNLKPGDTISATMNGARRKFLIVGLAEAPEFLFSAPPGEFTPDDRRFAVIWMSEKALAAAYDLTGAFNEALLSLSNDQSAKKVIREIDHILEPYGGLGAYDLDDHVSNRFITEEINGLKVTSQYVPPVFLLVAAFLLNIVVSRMIQAEREQIGLLKAFGYSSVEVVIHYFKFILAIAILGAILGCILGIISGRSLLVVYQIYYKFPFLLFQVDPRAFVTGFFVSVSAASAGGLFVLRGVFNLTPAVAMRPPTPPDYSRTIDFTKYIKDFVDQPTRMVIRRFTRQPIRVIGTVIGISSGMALSVASLNIMGAFDKAIDSSFSDLDRSDVRVFFVEPLSRKALFELEKIDGVIEVEAFRDVPVILRNGLNSYRGGISGRVKGAALSRALDKDLNSIELREEGVILGTALSEILKVKPGESVTLDVREGHRPTLSVPVVGIAETLIGSPAYMRLDSLNKNMKEPNRVSGAYLRIDSAKSQDVYKSIKDMSVVAGVSLKHQAREAFKELMNTGAGAVRFIMAAIAGVITLGIVYNSASIAFAERSRDLASLRVLGFTRNESAFVLLGELAILVVLSLPIGSVMGYYFTFAISKGFSTDLYQIPTLLVPASYGYAAIAVVFAAIASGWFVKRDINKMNLVLTLKTRE